MIAVIAIPAGSWLFARVRPERSEDAADKVRLANEDFDSSDCAPGYLNTDEMKSKHLLTIIRGDSNSQ